MSALDELDGLASGIRQRVADGGLGGLGEPTHVIVVLAFEGGYTSSPIVLGDADTAPPVIDTFICSVEAGDALAEQRAEDADDLPEVEEIAVHVGPETLQ